MVKEKVDHLKGIRQSKETSVPISTQDPATFNQILCLELPANSKANVLNAIKQLENREDVLYAGPDFYVYGYSTPNDYNASTQWGIGKISLPSAWNITTGSSYITVGIIDTGIDVDHPDLENQLNLTLSRNFIDEGAYSDITKKPGYHGTAVAGIIGAQGNNGTCITGVCWDVTLVSLRVFKESAPGEAGGETSDVIDAIQYAESAGIDILNYSGGILASKVEASDRTLYYQAIENYSGLFVCAAGNDNTDIDATMHYPSWFALPNIVCVGGSAENDTKVSNSNYGDVIVDLFAPGEYINSTAIGSSYSANTGTSFAAPFVTGVAALMLSIHPQLTPAQLRQALINSVDSVAAFENLCLSGGRLNAYKALTSSLIHTYSPNDYTTTGHCCQGLSCNYESPHTNGLPVPFNAGRHKSVCTYCGHETFSYHTYRTGSTICTACGYDSGGPGIMGVEDMICSIA